MEKLPVYEGEKPFIFISYAHANSPAVMQVVEELCVQGYRIWYDEGIEVGSEWPEYIASHLAGASLMLAFLSNAYARSDNCRKELHFALTKKIPVVTIFLEQASLSPGMEMQTGNLFALMKYSMDEEQFFRRLLSAPQLDPSLREEGAPEKRRRRRRKRIPVDLGEEERRKRRRKRRRLIAAAFVFLLLVAAAVLGIIGWSTGLVPRLLIRREQAEPVVLEGDTPAVFRCGALEEAARAWCGVAEGELRTADLAGLAELTLSGDRIGPEALSELIFFPDLQRLTIVDAPLVSLEAMPCCALETLTLENCPLSSLKGVGALPHLRELRVRACPLRELGDLGRCLELRQLSILGGNLHDLSSLRPLIRLSEAELSGCTLSELKPLLRNGALARLTLIDCDLRGKFFRSFDSERSIVSLSLTDCALSSTKNLEDFTGLTTLTLIRSGEELDFSVLAELPALKTVRTGPAMADELRGILRASSAVVETVE